MKTFRNHSPPAKHSAFTLIELLTVIAIIGILAAIIIPVVGKVRESANSAKCANNLRQIQMANIAYAVDHKNHYAPIFGSDPDVPSTKIAWHKNSDYLSYLGVSDTVSSPALPVSLFCPSSIAKGRNPKDYAYSHGANLPADPTGNSNYNNPGTSRILSVSEVVNPSRTLAFADALDWNIIGSAADKYVGNETKINQAVAYRHDNTTNIVFFDGHVEKRTMEQLKRNGTKDASIWLLNP